MSQTPPGGRVAVCVSGQGSNLRALGAAERRGSLGGSIVLVVADRDCPAIEFARDAGIATAVVRPADFADRDAWDGALAGALAAAAPDLVVLAGFMRVLGPAALASYPRRILNVHPALLPAFPGKDGIADALAAGVAVTGVTVHLVDEHLDGGPIVAQEAVRVLAGDDRDSLAARIHAVEHRLLPRCVALALAGALRVDGPHVRIDPSIAAGLPAPRRALLSVSDKTGLVEFARDLDALGIELVSTGGTARELRDAGLPVTDVSSVTGVPEMLDGRVKTLHPAIAGGVLADLRLEKHREQLVLAGIEPFELLAANLYRFAEAAGRPDVDLDALIEEIDIGGPTLVRAAAKNHANAAIVTDPARYVEVITELRDRGRISERTRRALAVDAFRLVAAYDAAIAAELGRRLGPADASGDASSPSDPLPPAIDVRLERVERLRYGENPHQAAALYRVPGTPPTAGPYATGVRPIQGKGLSYNNLLDAAAAAALARDLRGRAVAIVKHGNPCGAAEAPDLLGAWDRAWAGDPASAYGGVVAVRGCVDRPLAERIAAVFVELVVAADFDASALERLAARPNLRLLRDPSMLTAPEVRLELRSAGGGILVTESDALPDDPAGWQTVTARAPSDAERRDLDLAWRICRRVASNAIVLVRDGALAGVGAGQMSRVDSGRLAVAKAGVERARGAACASDAFFPFADGLEACAEAGVTAFVQPGGSMRDADVIAAADRAGAAMLFTGRRRFRH